MFDKVLNIPLDELSCSAVVLRGIHKKVDICQTDHSIHSKQRIFSYSLVIYGSTQANERLTKVFVVFVLSVISFAPMSQTIGVIDRSSAWYSLHISNLWCVCWSVCMWSHVSNGEDWERGHGSHYPVYLYNDPLLSMPIRIENVFFKQIFKQVVP